MYKLLKEIIDRSISLITLLVVSPLFLLIWAVISFEMGNPVFFKQARPGKNSNVFNFYKFRTMTDAVDIHGQSLPDAQRLTALGKFLRKTSLDEVPQLINVLKGDMSFVGPRPLLVEYLDCYTPEQIRRHEVKPGITGWAQVNGRNTIAWEEKFRLDVWYVENQSLWLDMKILYLTVAKVLKAEGISNPNHATMEKFQGSSSVIE